MNNKILENKNNFLIVKENNLIKLFSFRSLVSIYDTDTKQFKDVSYTFVNDDGNVCSYSVTTTRHQIKFKNYVINKGF